MNLKAFNLFLWIHFSEHIAQVSQLYLLHLPRVDCLGILGLWFPYLIKTEILHFAFALFTLIGLIYFNHYRKFKTAINLSWFHLFEHQLLLTQALFGFKRTGIGGLFFPRIELHFFYNLIIMLAITYSLKNSRGVSV